MVSLRSGPDQAGLNLSADTQRGWDSVCNGAGFPRGGIDTLWPRGAGWRIKTLLDNPDQAVRLAEQAEPSSAGSV